MTLTPGEKEELRQKKDSFNYDLTKLTEICL